MKLISKSISALACVFFSWLGEGLVDDKGEAEVLVVLGNQVYSDGTPAPRLKARLDHALFLSKKSSTLHTLVVSGAVGDSGVNEAVAMADYVKGKTSLKIVIDGAGATTRLSALNCAQLFASDVKIQVVSQYFHVPRSMLAFRQAGFTSVTGAAPAYVEKRDLFSVPRDFVGFFAYALKLK